MPTPARIGRGPVGVACCNRTRRPLPMAIGALAGRTGPPAFQHPIPRAPGRGNACGAFLTICGGPSKRTGRRFSLNSLSNPPLTGIMSTVFLPPGILSPCGKLCGSCGNSNIYKHSTPSLPSRPKVGLELFGREKLANEMVPPPGSRRAKVRPAQRPLTAGLPTRSLVPPPHMEPAGTGLPCGPLLLPVPRNPHPPCNLWAITRAAFTPDAPAWARPRVTPAPSPTAKKPGKAVSSSLDSWMRAE